jgi:hypothetical protein
MVGQKMTFLDPAFLLFGELPEYFTQVLAQASIQHLAPTLGDKNNVVLALPLRVLIDCCIKTAML